MDICSAKQQPLSAAKPALMGAHPNFRFGSGPAVASIRKRPFEAISGGKTAYRPRASRRQTEAKCPLWPNCSLRLSGRILS